MVIFNEDSKNLQIPVGIGNLSQNETDLIEYAYCKGCEECGSGNVPFNKLEKFNKYLYSANYNKLNYDFAKEELKERYNSLGACSAFRKDNIYARNYDWYYDDTVTFVVKTDRNGIRVNASEDIDNARYKTLCVASGIPTLTTDFVESGDFSDDIYKLIPFMVVDGLNEKGLTISTLIVPNTYGKTTGTTALIEERDSINAIMLPRYVLDNFDTALSAIEYIRDYVRVSMPNNESLNIQTHYLISDVNDTYVIEFIGNDIEFTKVGENEDLPSILTNFHVKGVNLYEGKADYFNSNIEDYGQGLERYNAILSVLSGITSVQDALTILCTTLKFTNAYNASIVPLWKTEFTGYTSTFGSLTIEQPIEDFEPIMTYARSLFENRSRYEGKDTWQTIHSAVYDIDLKALNIVVQEQEASTSIRFTLNEGGVEEAPLDGSIYGRIDGTWEVIPEPDLSDYYTKEETNEVVDNAIISEDASIVSYVNNTRYTKEEVDTLLDEKQDTLVSGVNIKTVGGQTLLGSGDIELPSVFEAVVVDELPEASEETQGKMYLVPKDGEQESNVKDEYITIFAEGAYSWEKIGDTEIDLSNYYDKDEVNEIIEEDERVTSIALNLLEENKQDKLTAGSNILINGDNVISVYGMLTEAPIDGKQYARKNAGWAEVTADVTSEDLQEVERVTAIALNLLEENKQDKLTAGSNITIVDNVISATGGSKMKYVNIESLTPNSAIGLDVYEHPDEYILYEELLGGGYIFYFYCGGKNFSCEKFSYGNVEYDTYRINSNGTITFQESATKNITYSRGNIDTLLAAKQDVLTAGENITIVDNVISATGGGGGADIVELTQEEYNALTPEQKANGSLYSITDATVYDMTQYYTKTETNEAFNPINNTTASSSGYKFPTWNAHGQITGIYNTAYQAPFSINGSTKYAYNTSSSSWGSIYAPTTAGTLGQVLLSNGSGAPVWSEYKSDATSYLNDADMASKTYSTSISDYYQSCIEESKVQPVQIVINETYTEPKYELVEEQSTFVTDDYFAVENTTGNIILTTTDSKTLIIDGETGEIDSTSTLSANFVTTDGTYIILQLNEGTTFNEIGIYTVTVTTETITANSQYLPSSSRMYADIVELFLMFTEEGDVWTRYKYTITSTSVSREVTNGTFGA